MSETQRLQLPRDMGGLISEIDLVRMNLHLRCIDEMGRIIARRSMAYGRIKHSERYPFGSQDRYSWHAKASGLKR
jgi:hypothetical protein